MRAPGSEPIRTARPGSPARAVCLCVLLALLAAIALLYGHTLQVSWYFDDYQILDKPALHSLAGALRQLLAQRGVANLTLALNYRFGDADPTGYHLVNLVIHAASGWLVFLLLQRIFPGTLRWPLLGALLFIAHPLQTQAVTYVIQRMTSLSGCFVFLALNLHLKAQETRHRRLMLAGALLCGALAVYCKENAVVLPFLLLLFDDLVRPDLPLRRRLREILPYCVVPLLYAVQHLLLPLLRGSSLADLTAAPVTAATTPLTYLFTEFQVLWLYLRLLVLPVRQMLDYDFPLVSTLLDLRSLLALAGLLVLGFLAWQQRRKRPALAFGTAWFFAALAIESSLIPLDPVFEHRLYLPLFGFVVVVIALAAACPRQRLATGVLVAALLLLALLTWQRNALWTDPVRFFEDNLAKAPKSARVRVNLAHHYREARRYGEAQQLLEAAIRLDPLYAKSYKALASLYREWGMRQRAAELLDSGLKRLPGDILLTHEAAQLRLEQQEPEAALAYLQAGLALHPESDYLYNTLGQSYDALGRWPEAEAAFRQSLKFHPANPIARCNLGKVLFRQERFPEALREFQRALDDDPGYSQALQGAWLSARRSGETATAEWAAKRLQRLDPSAWERLGTQAERP